MSQYDNLIQALQSRVMNSQMAYDQSLVDMVPYQQKMQEATTQRFTGIIPGLIEMAYDAHKRKKVEPELSARLKEAQGIKYGLDAAQTELAALVKQQEEAEQRAREEEIAARNQGYKSALQSQKDAAAMERTKARGNQPNVTYNVPSEYMLLDPSNPMAGVRAMPGTKTAMEMEERQAKAQKKENSNRANYSNLIDVADKALTELSKPYTSGITGAMASGVPASRRKALEGHLTTLKANLGFDRLQQMREESPTGGALGQVAVQELVSLQSTLANTDPDLPPDVLAENIKIIQNHYKNFLSALDGVDPYAEQGRQPASPGGNLPPLPSGFQID